MEINKTRSAVTTEPPTTGTHPRRIPSSAKALWEFQIDPLPEFDMQLEGALAGNRITVQGTIEGFPHQLHAILTKRRDLPPRP